MRKGVLNNTCGNIVVWIVLILFARGFQGSAQVFYSTNPEYLSVKEEQNNLLSNYRYAYPDTLVSNIANYFPRNFLGNMGLASPNYQFHYGSDPLGFRLWKAPLDNDRVYDEQVTYYRSKGPFADLTGIAGSKEFQIFKALFTHTFRDNMNVTLRFNRYTSKGFYQRQQSFTNNFFLSSNYTSKNKRWGYYLYLLNNGNKNNENGGIRDGRLNDSTMSLNKEILAINLSQASRDNREMKIMANPWLRLNSRSDSSHKADHYLQLKSKMAFLSNRYKDEGIRSDNFYTYYYVDTLLTRDSAHVFQWRNEMSYNRISKRGAGFAIGYANEFNKVHQFVDSLFMHHMIFSDLHVSRSLKKDSTGRVTRSLQSRVHLEYILAGPNAGNYRVESRNELLLNTHQRSSVYLNILAESRSADYIYNTWLSNHFYWFNKGLGPQQQWQVKLGYQLGRVLDVSVFNQHMRQYLYFDSLANPAQLSSGLNNLGLQLNAMKIFFKHLGLGLGYVYQHSTRSDVVRIPSNIASAKLFYHGNLFKNNLQLQFGAQVQMYDAFYAYAYMPSTQVFYLQNKTKTEAYPYVDVFLQARIRPVSFFIKVENALQGLAGPNYALTPGYYQTDRAFRFGINWVFFD